MANKHVQFAESLHAQQMKYKPDQINVAAGVRSATALAQVAPRTPNVMDEQFPTASLTQYEPEKDREMVARLQLQDGAPTGYTPFGKMIARDSDFEWYMRKQAAAEKANFQRWFAENFDHMSPAEKQIAKRLYPEFYRERKQLLKVQTKNLMRLAKLKLEGPQSIKDLQTQYLAETGRLDVGPLQNLLHPEQAETFGQAHSQGAFRRGLANPFLAMGRFAYGDDTLGGRQVEAKSFAEREYAKQNYELGFGNQGFPPLNNANEAQVGDAAWFKVLKSGLPNM